MYHLVYNFLYLISLLPLGVLYLFSDLAYFIIYHLFGYRKKVVLQNLTIAFPHINNEEKIIIAKGFYKNFCDTFIETIKFISADEKFFRRHFTADYSILDEVLASGRSVQLHLGHNFNWELANLAFPLFIPCKTLVVYAPLQNKTMNRLLMKIRSKMGTHLISSLNLKSDILPHRSTQFVYALIADQTPLDVSKAYWIIFFNKPTPFFKGPEKSAKLNNFSVVFCHFTKSIRGKYVGHAKLATSSPRSLPEGALTKMYANYIEELMSANPEMWLWSHRRWKREWKEEYGEVM